MYKGIIIAESLEEPSIINEFKVYRAEISEEEENIINENRKARWHLYWVEVNKEQIDLVMRGIKQGWYAHFWKGKDMIVVFKDKKFNINFDDKSTWKEAVEYGKSLGIKEEQLDFPLDD